MWVGVVRKVPRLYPVSSQSEKGISLLQEQEIRYYTDKVYVLERVEIIRTKGYFVYRNGEGWYRLEPEIAEQYGFEPAYTWFQRYGVWISVCLLILFIFLFTFWGDKSNSKGDADLPDTDQSTGDYIDIQ
jgi:hypothetical protein